MKELLMISFIEVLNILEARDLVDQIEELIGEEEAELVRIRTNLIKELKCLTGYEYIF